MTGDPVPVTTTHAIARFAVERPDAIAVVDDGVGYSYGVLAAHVIGTIRRLTAAGAGHGTIAGIECDLRYVHLVLILACEAVGAAHLALTARDLAGGGEPVTKCDLLCVMTPDTRCHAGQTLLQLDMAFVAWLTAEITAGTGLDLLDTTYPGDTVVRIGGTSGTTGRAKYLATTRRVMESIHRAGQFVLGDEARHYNLVCPYGFHILTTYREANHVLRHGGTVVFTALSRWYSDAERFSPCQTFLLVSDAARIAGQHVRQTAPLDQCLLRLIGAAVPPSLLARITAHLVTRTFSQYSTNESNLVAVMDENDVGTLLPDVEIRIVDEADCDAAAGIPGAILVRSPRTCDGYLWDPAQTRQRFAGGWYRTNDLGVMRGPRELAVIGRVDDVLNIGGIKFAPNPLEDRIRELAGVRDAVLVVVSGADGAGALHVAVETDANADTAAMEAAIAGVLTGYVTVFEWHAFDALPRTPTGKPRRDAVREAVHNRSASQNPAGTGAAGIAG